mmetsp:Transcript_132152/g.247085  ORF Transcript_132152/g.247085 Transcript_132152/m.247085 type:complete len:82 (+) Transcript_132152:1519-1764(+)
MPAEHLLGARKSVVCLLLQMAENLVGAWNAVDWRVLQMGEHLDAAAVPALEVPPALSVPPLEKRVQFSSQQTVVVAVLPPF